MMMSDQGGYDGQHDGNGQVRQGISPVSRSARGPALAPIAMCLASIVILGMASLWAAVGAKPDGDGQSPSPNGSTGAIAAVDTSRPHNAEDAGDTSPPERPEPGPMTATELSAYASRAVVRITGPAGGGGSVTGSGFFVRGDGLLATNLHVIAGAKSLRAITSKGVSVPVVAVVATDPTCDLALLKVQANAAGAWPFLTVAGDQTPVIGTKVYALGFPLGLDLTLSEGLISALKKEGATLNRIQTTAAISQGSSGGPILLSNGKVIGVAVGMYRSGQNMNLAVPAAKLAKLMADYAQQPPRAAPPTTGERRQRTGVRP